MLAARAVAVERALQRRVDLEAHGAAAAAAGDGQLDVRGHAWTLPAAGRCITVRRRCLRRRMTITPGRLVALLTPLIFAPSRAASPSSPPAICRASTSTRVRCSRSSSPGRRSPSARPRRGSGLAGWEKREADAPADIGHLPVDHAEVHDDSGLDQAPAVAQDAGAEQDPMQDDPIEEEDPVDGEEPDFDDGDLDDLFAAPVAAGNEG